MAGIRKRGENSYEIRVYMDGPDGKAIRRSMTFRPKETAPSKVKKEVAAAAADFERRVRAGAYVSAEVMTFAELADRWYSVYAETNVSLGIREGYRRMLDKKIVPAIGAMELSRITPLVLQDLCDGLAADGKSPSTIRNYFKVIRSVLRAGVMWDILEHNPCERVVLPKLGPRYKYTVWTPEQVKIFLGALQEQYTYHFAERTRTDGSGEAYAVAPYDVEKGISKMFVALFSLMIYSSARRGEICALTWEDVDFRAAEISISKAASTTRSAGQIVKGTKTEAGHRRVAVPKEALAALSAWKVEEMELSMRLGSLWEGFRGPEFNRNYVFIQRHSGRMICADTIGKKFREVVELYNAKQKREKDRLPVIRLHDLRHTGASLMVSSGVDIVTVSHRLGHAKPSTTLDIYSHALPAKDREASEALRDVIEAKKAASK